MPGTILSLTWNNLHLLFLAFCVVGQHILELPCLEHDIRSALCWGWTPEPTLMAGLMLG